ncbi:MAG: [FeFe] hydrogenase, group A [Oscillospiraceae bacterium]|nr:[FeFe] hydrogenase, group A [Oscillospiraceae bacterium]
MGTMTIDGRRVSFTDEKNVLSVIRSAGIDIPTLCYHSEVSTFGACRLCTVEDDKGHTFASCSEEPRDGMVIYTNTGRIRKYRKMIVELLLAAHHRDCTTCVKSGMCNLQELAHRLGVRNVRFQNTRELRPIDNSSPSIVRDPNKCILCGDCVRACTELQGIGVLGFAYRGTDAMVMPAFNRPIAETQCVNCGQCRVYCPTGAISVHSSVDEVWDALSEPNTRVVAQIAPAVRVAIGDYLGLPKGTNAMGYIVSAMHQMGFDEVYDTSFSADLTVMEESAEFINRVESGLRLPLLTSCCPAWVKYVIDQYPTLVPNLSTCRSPQGMMSAIVKEYYRDPQKAAGRRTVMVSVMPCTAKKMEAKRPNSFTKGEQDTDIVITTTELIRMIKLVGLDFANLVPEASDIPFGLGSGGGTIFGVTGGVTEAVLRRLIPEHDKIALDNIAASGVRGNKGVKELTVQHNGQDINICVVNGLAQARAVMEQVKAGQSPYHMIEVMACRRGCIMGGGQPPIDHSRVREERMINLYNIDNVSIIKKPDDNPLMYSLYDGLLKGKAHELLHNTGY